MARSSELASGAVLFDLDGTLIATKRLYLECYRRAIAPHADGPEPSREDIMALDPRSELETLKSQVGEDGLAACKEEFYRHYEELHETHFEGVYDGVPALLDVLRSAGRPLGLVTGKSRRAWEITVARVELGPFDVMVFDDDVARPKPDPQGLVRALDVLDAAAEDALYVGDGMGDVGAANAAGLRAGAVLWSKREERRERFRERAEREGAEIFATPEALLERIVGRAEPARPGG